ncbi:DNA cytosine methyltransferase, partial [Aureimonas sp. ME7]|uniref:DNA cytosine methyltransferase n=1 Tax=Aureimonas sp. ME7 TaxID=2744252 RepID=UPI0015F398E3
MSGLRTLDLFSGIGGFALGLERTGGFKTAAFCEVADFPRRVLEKHWPEVPRYADIRDLTATRLVRDGITVDVVCGGFPCQPFSTASRGRRVAFDFWPEMYRVVGELRPEYVIAE